MNIKIIFSALLTLSAFSSLRPYDNNILDHITRLAQAHTECKKQQINILDTHLQNGYYLSVIKQEQEHQIASGMKKQQPNFTWIGKELGLIKDKNASNENFIQQVTTALKDLQITNENEYNRIIYMQADKYFDNVCIPIDPFADFRAHSTLPPDQQETIIKNIKAVARTYISLESMTIQYLNKLFLESNSTITRQEYLQTLRIIKSDLPHIEVSNIQQTKASIHALIDILHNKGYLSSSQFNYLTLTL